MNEFFSDLKRSSKTNTKKVFHNLIKIILRKPMRHG